VRSEACVARRHACAAREGAGGAARLLDRVNYVLGEQRDEDSEDGEPHERAVPAISGKVLLPSARAVCSASDERAAPAEHRLLVVIVVVAADGAALVVLLLRAFALREVRLRGSGADGSARTHAGERRRRRVRGGRGWWIGS
jgi:hypothetical protein